MSFKLSIAALALLIAGAWGVGARKINAIPAADCYACYWEVCGGNGSIHWDDRLTNGTVRGGTTHQSCTAGSCSEHTKCSDDLTESDMRMLLNAYENDDAEAIARLAMTNDGAIYMNRDRNALQVHGCNGRLSAHLPLKTGMLDRVSTLAATYSNQQ